MSALQRRLGLALLIRRHHALSALLHHAPLPLLLHVLLLLAQGQRVRDAEQQDTGGDDPEALSTVVDCRVGRGEDRG
jgi:hypothetical protein